MAGGNRHRIELWKDWVGLENMTLRAIEVLVPQKIVGINKLEQEEARG